MYGTAGRAGSNAARGRENGRTDGGEIKPALTAS